MYVLNPHGEVVCRIWSILIGWQYLPFIIKKNFIKRPVPLNRRIAKLNWSW